LIYRAAASLWLKTFCGSMGSGFFYEGTSVLVSLASVSILAYSLAGYWLTYLVSSSSASSYQLSKSASSSAINC